GEDQLAQQFGPLLSNTEGDVATAGMPHQIHGAGVQFLDEPDHVGDMLRYKVVLADGIPVLGEKVPQAERNHAPGLRQRTPYCRPCPEVAQGAMDADQRSTLSDLEIGDVVTIDLKRLHRKSRCCGMLDNPTEGVQCP